MIGIKQREKNLQNHNKIKLNNFQLIKFQAVPLLLFELKKRRNHIEGILQIQAMF